MKGHAKSKAATVALNSALIMIAMPYKAFRRHSIELQHSRQYHRIRKAFRIDCQV